jgi:hypothetical protein
MFRTNRNVAEPARNTFDNVKRTLEPTLYALRYEHTFESGPTVVHHGSDYPIPYYFEPGTNVKKKAWHIGNLVIDHLSTGVVKIVTVAIGASKKGSPAVVLNVMVCPLGGVAGGPYPLKWFEAELIDVDLTPYDAIGIAYQLDSGPVEQFTFATQLLWRPKLL